MFIFMTDQTERYRSLIPQLCEMLHGMPNELHRIRHRGEALIESLQFCQTFAGKHKEKTPILSKYINTIQQHFDQFQYEIGRVIDTQMSSVLFGVQAWLLHMSSELAHAFPMVLPNLRPVTSSGFNPLHRIFRLLHDTLGLLEAVELSLAR